MSTAPGSPLRVGVIGTGFGATVHIPAFRRAPDFEVVAVVSRRRERAEQVARDAGIGWFSDDYRAMLNEVDLDVVSISTSAGLHREMVLAAAAAGRHILCEKPFATSVAEADDMLAAVNSAGVRHAINHEFRMVPARRAVRQQVLDGFVGTPFDVRVIQDLGMLLDPARGWTWWSDRDQYGGTMQAFTSHLIDFLLWTFGDIASVSALVDTFIRSRRTPEGAERPVTSDDQNISLLRFANGASGLMHVSGVYRLPRTSFEVQGSSGALSIDNNQVFAVREVGKPQPVALPPLEGLGEGENEGPVAWMAAYLAHVARVFRGEADDSVATFEQGRRVQVIMDAIHASGEREGDRIVIAHV